MMPTNDRSLDERYELNLPAYPGTAQIVELHQQDGGGRL